MNDEKQTLDIPYLILIAGLPGTGKQTAAEKLHKHSKNFELIDQNELRRAAGMKKMPQKQDTILRQIDRITAEYLREGKGVIVLAGHRQVARRNQLYGIASSCEKKVITLECFCSEEEATRRILKRNPKDGLVSKPTDPEVYYRIKNLWENIWMDFRYPGHDFISYLRYNTEKNTISCEKVEFSMREFTRTIEKILLRY